MNKIFKYSLMLLAGASMLTACNWTEPESVDLRYDTIKDADPDTYAKYLSGLRSYRENGHKKVYAWFDNKSSFTSQADHVSAVPDSIDVLVLTRPGEMTQATLDEIDAKRSETGMQTAYMVDYATIRKAWELQQELGQGGEWSDFMTAELKKELAYFDNGGFDRIICSYDGKDMSTGTGADQSAYAADQKLWFDTFNTWRTSHMDKGFDFVGIPAHLSSQDLIKDAGVVFLSETTKATNADELTYIVTRNSVSGAPVAKFAVMAALPVLDPTQAGVGYWGSDYASWLTARWARANNVAAVGLLNLSDDYYHPSFIYPVCRGAIQILNPAAK